MFANKPTIPKIKVLTFGKINAYILINKAFNLVTIKCLFANGGTITNIKFKEKSF